MKETVVLFPGWGMGHLTPMVELAKLFILHDFSVTVVVMHFPFEQPAVAPFITRVATAHPAITFHHLPPVPASAYPPAAAVHPFVLAHELLRLNNPHLLRLLTALSQNSSLRAVVLDFFCSDALDVAAELHLPAYIFSCTNAACLAAFIHIPFFHSATSLSLRDLGDARVSFPGLPPIPASHMPSLLLDRDSAAYKIFVYHSIRITLADGIMENSFESLETRAIQALRNGSCIPGSRMPPVYCIGPLIAKGTQDVMRPECIEWLDSQPRGSVVFLCFGSMGSFSARQLREMAAGLERSGQRFLWVVRTPRSDDPSKMLERRPPPDLEKLLPEGFLGRTKERGLVVKSWAPQAEVLRHEAVGGFVTHCGWNSALEAITAGVAMVGWPLYAEQRMNKAWLVEEMELAVPVEGYDKELVTAEEVEAKIRWLMESEGGRELRERAANVKEMAAEAWGEGGSSIEAWLAVVRALTEEKANV